MFRLDQSFKPGSQAGPLRRINLDLEHRILHALAIITAGPGYTPQASGSSAFASADIVGHENNHVDPSSDWAGARRASFPDPWWISVEIASEVPCEKLRLQMRNKAKRRRFVQKRVTPFFLLALLPRCRDRAAAVVGEQHRAAIARLEISRPQLAAVEQRKRQPVRKDGRNSFIRSSARLGRPGRSR